MNPERVVDCGCELGEGPLWHPEERRLYWVDIPSGRLLRWRPGQAARETFLGGEAVGGCTLQADGSLLLFMAGGAIRRWDPAAPESLAEVVEGIPDERETRFNDVIADPAGRVFCGTLPAPGRLGRLYRLDTDGSLRVVLEGVGCSNGMGFTPDRRGMYFTDSPTRTIDLFDYDAATGELSNRRTFARTPDDEGVPDGMTVDAEGFVWSARWGGACVVRYAPDGSVAGRVELPTPKVTSVMFGGDDLSDLYVTTAGGSGSAGGPAGAVFRVRPGVGGVSEFRSQIV